MMFQHGPKQRHPCPCRATGSRALQPHRCALEANTKQHANARGGKKVDEADVSPVYSVPPPVLPVHPATRRSHRVQVADVRNQQADDKSAPDFAVSSGAQNAGLEDHEAQIEIGQLCHYNGGRDGDRGAWSTRGMGQGQVGRLQRVGIDCSQEDRDRLDPEKDKAVEGGYARRRRCGHGVLRAGLCADGDSGGCCTVGAVRCERTRWRASHHVDKHGTTGEALLVERLLRCALRSSRLAVRVRRVAAGSAEASGPKFGWQRCLFVRTPHVF
mgnify:CR=1 FL=1